MFTELYLFQARKCGVQSIDKEMGKLLYNIATKLKTQIKIHQAMIVEYITKQKITTEIQLNGIQILKKWKDTLCFCTK